MRKGRALQHEGNTPIQTGNIQYRETVVVWFSCGKSQVY